nr:hypothetical protein [Tanacetum cinerariifolium]
MLSKYVIIRTQILDHPLALENDLGFTNPIIYTIEFSAHGLSRIATKLGMLMMLDSYMSDMCLEAWEHGNEASKKHNDTSTSGSYKNLNVVNNNGNNMAMANILYVLNKVLNEKDVTPSSVLGATGAKDGSNPTNNKASDLGAEESDSEVVEIFNETTSFMAPNQSKVSSSSTSEGGNRKSSLYDKPYDDDDDNDNGDDDANEEYTEAYMAFYKKFDIIDVLV